MIASSYPPDPMLEELLKIWARLDEANRRIIMLAAQTVAVDAGIRRREDWMPQPELEEE